MNNRGFTVCSSHGTFIVQKNTGRVLRFDIANKESDNLSDIKVFNTAEWISYYNTHGFISDTIDILDLGYWQGGNYVEPAHEWRELMKELEN